MIRIGLSLVPARGILVLLSWAACLAGPADPAHVLVGWGAMGGLENSDRFLPRRVVSCEALPGQPFIDAACGNQHSLVLTSQGDVYSWPRGTSANPPYTNVVRMDFGGAKIQKIVAGGFHSLALSTEGELFAWGDNAYSQLGDGTSLRRDIPVRVHIGGGKFEIIAAGWQHSLAVNESGQLYAWGDNSYGQLGAEAFSTNVVLVSSHTNLAGVKIVAVGGGGYHSVALTEDGRVFTWGFATAGGTGLPPTFTAPTPSLVDTNGVLAGKRIVAITTQGFQNLVLTSDGGLFGWGRNLFGSLGMGGTSHAYLPVAVDVSGVLAGKTIAQISGGWDFAMVLTTDGEIFGWGRNVDGELGQGRYFSQSSRPVAVVRSRALTGRIITRLGHGSYADHVIALTQAVSVLDIVPSSKSPKLGLWGLPRRTYRIHESQQLDSLARGGLVRETTLDSTGRAEFPLAPAAERTFWTAELLPGY